MPPERRIEFRIGINVGDIIIDESDIFGDGVNVAARLEALAEPGGICISRMVRDQVRDKLALTFEDLGEPSPGITRLQRYCGPLRHPSAPGLSLASVRLIIPDHALGLPVLRALSLSTCRRHYPGAAAGCLPHPSHPPCQPSPEGVAGSACTSSFSRLARRSLALRPTHSRGHQFVTR